MALTIIDPPAELVIQKDLFVSPFYTRTRAYTGTMKTLTKPVRKWLNECTTDKWYLRNKKPIRVRLEPAGWYSPRNKHHKVEAVPGRPRPDIELVFHDAGDAAHFKMRWL
jgi:hypothetical protein